MNKAKTKCSKAKAKIEKKVANGKAKVAKKCAKACAIASVLLLISGCQNPAQRAQTAETKIEIFGGNVSFGNEFVSLAQANETGGNDAGQVATPTNDIKPDVDVSVGAAKGGGLLETAASKLLGGSSSGKTESATAVVDPLCPDGACKYNP